MKSNIFMDLYIQYRGQRSTNLKVKYKKVTVQRLKVNIKFYIWAMENRKGPQGDNAYFSIQQSMIRKVNFDEISILRWNDTFVTGECTPSILMLIGHYFSAFHTFCATVSHFNNYCATVHVHTRMHTHASLTEDVIIFLLCKLLQLISIPQTS